MTTAVQPTRVAPAEAQEQSLATWLTEPVQTLEENVGAFVTALQSTHIAPEAREGVAAALLRLLSPDGTRHPALRRACVEAVLQLGYPWALQLEPEDVTEAREAAQAARPTSRLRRALIIAGTATALGAFGLGGGALVVWRHLLQQLTQPIPAVALQPPAPRPVAVQPPSGVVEAAAKVAQLRARGDFDEAVGLAEACAVTFEAPRPCVKQLAALASDAANRTDDSFDRYAARQWASLADEPDAVLVRERGRVLLSHDFARDASFLPPLDDLGGRLLMGFVESELRLERAGRWQELGNNAANCVDSGGQAGAVCRAFYARALEQRQLPARSRPADLPVTAQSRVADHVRTIIELRVKDRLDDAITEADRCVGDTPAATDCQHLLVDALTRRYRDEGDPADKQLADRWRQTLGTTPHAPTPPKPRE